MPGFKLPTNLNNNLHGSEQARPGNLDVKIVAANLPISITSMSITDSSSWAVLVIVINDYRDYYSVLLGVEGLGEPGAAGDRFRHAVLPADPDRDLAR
eukprot:3867664-Rhodomonas_salina.2